MCYCRCSEQERWHEHGEVKHLWDALPHYNWQTRGRHLFLATGDIKDLPVEIQGQPLVLPLT